MELSAIPRVRFEEGGGVTFRYLVLILKLRGERKSALRALTYLPSRKGMERQILAWTKGELDTAGFFANGGEFVVDGGGSLTHNPYDETICLFGANPAYGPENNRESVAQLVEAAFPGHKVSWFLADDRPAKTATEKAGA
jgi:hypothetical protein